MSGIAIKIWGSITHTVPTCKTLWLGGKRPDLNSTAADSEALNPIPLTTRASAGKTWLENLNRMLLP